jgi:phage-related minor tail protein
MVMAGKPKKQQVAFAQGGFAGGFVDKPTRFQFAQGGEIRDGLMGEAGGEFIMPAARMPNGDMGVAAQGGGPPQIISWVDAGKYFLGLFNNGYLGVASAENVR